MKHETSISRMLRPITREDEERWDREDAERAAKSAELRRLLRAVIKAATASIEAFAVNPQDDEKFGRLCRDLSRHFEPLRADPAHKAARLRWLGEALEYAESQRRRPGFQSPVHNWQLWDWYEEQPGAADWTRSTGKVNKKACKAVSSIAAKHGHRRLSPDTVQKRIRTILRSLQSIPPE